MSNTKKPLAVLSMSAIAGLLAVAVTTPVSANATAIVVNGKDAKAYEYNYSALKTSAVAAVTNDTTGATLYNDFLTRKNTIKAYFDDVHKAYVDFAVVSAAATDDILAGKTFDFKGFLEKTTTQTVSLTPDKVAVGTDGKVLVTPPTPVVTNVTISSVNAITDTKLNVKLSAAVDDVAATNFSIAGVTVNSATLSTDKTSVTLDVAGLQVNQTYTVKATGLKVNAVVQPDATLEYKMPDATKLFTPEVTLKDSVLKADGLSSTLITFTLKDANGNVMTSADKVEIAFTATFGRLANQRVTVQNGVATNLLTSETLDSAKTADITATIVEAANKNLIGLKAEKTIVLSPNPEAPVDEKTGLTMTEVQAAQADRVIAYFNKDVDITKYVGTGTYALDSAKAVATVKTDVANDLTGGHAVNVTGVLPVQGNSKALQLILADKLVDNANLLVDFTDKTGTITTNSEKSCKLTDARKPAMLSVAREGLKTLKVTFSEPVNSAYANVLTNWVVDGVRLDDPAYGVATTTATAIVGDFYAADQIDGTKAGTDTRNVVTITLGKDKDGNQIYFKSGTHSIQGSSIGDWANLTDIGNNVMSTQTLDFDIPVDTTAPNATVEVQSPEQYVVTFDKDLVSALTAGKLQLQKYNKTTGTWDAYATQALQVTPIAGTSSYKVEVTKDWTDTTVYNTSTSHLNYYNDNYRLFIAKDTVAAAANGIKNADISLSLGGAITTPDITSPVINDIAEVKDTTGTVTGYKVTMSEPVKISADGLATSDGLATFAQGQSGKLPVVTAQFIKKDGSKTIDGTVTAFADPYDKTISVVPASPLDGGEWTLVVRSISDDVGNTAASANKDFTVAGSIVGTTKFAVQWSFADANKDLDDQDTGVAVGDGADYVYVKFNEPISVTGDAKNALKQSNYQLDGMPLPTGTQIRANIAGLDDKDAATDSITIVLPDGYLNGNEQPHVLTISNYLESSVAGDVLTNGGAKKLTWTADTTTIFGGQLTAEKSIYLVETAALKDLTNATNLGDAKTALATATPILAAVDTHAVELAQLTARLDAVKVKIDAADAAGTIAAAKTALGNAITADTTQANAAVAGTAVGNYAQADIDTYKAAIATAKTVYDSTTSTTQNFTDAKAALDTAKATFEGKVVVAATLQSIAITHVPTKTTYNVGDVSMDLGGLVVTGTYSDTTTKQETIAAGNVQGFDTTSAGTKTITVTVNGKTAIFDITVNAVTLAPAVKTADAAYNVAADYSVVTSIKVDGTEVVLTNVKLLNGTTTPIAVDAMKTALNQDLAAAGVSGITATEVGGKIVLTTSGSGIAATVDLTGSDVPSATALGFTNLDAVHGTN